MERYKSLRCKTMNLRMMKVEENVHESVRAESQEWIQDSSEYSPDQGAADSDRLEEEWTNGRPVALRLECSIDLGLVIDEGRDSCGDPATKSREEGREKSSQFEDRKGDHQGVRVTTKSECRTLTVVVARREVIASS